MGDDIEINPYYGVFPYRDFLKEEGIPVFEGYAVDCHTVPVEPWERLGGLGTYVHVAGKSDYLSAYVVEIPPGGELKPEQHMHDKLMHVVSGRGSTMIERPDGRRYSFEWGPSAIFAIPLNAKHQIFNGSGTEPARLAAVTDLPIIFNIFRNPDFIFDNPFAFPERMAAEKYFDGEGEFRQVKPGRHQWETCFVPELVNFELPPWVARGAARQQPSSSCWATRRCTATSRSSSRGRTRRRTRTTRARTSSASPARATPCSGRRARTLWTRCASTGSRARSTRPPDGPTYHQHFNVSPGQSALPSCSTSGGARYPVLESKMWNYENMDKSEKAGRDADRVRRRGPAHPRPLRERAHEARPSSSRMHEFHPRPGVRRRASATM